MRRGKTSPTQKPQTDGMSGTHDTLPAVARYAPVTCISARLATTPGALTGLADVDADAPPRDLLRLLSRIDAELAACGFDRLGALAHDVAAFAAESGMRELRLVANSVLDCIASGDAAALGATMARLGRCGHAVLSDWDPSPE